MLKPTICYISSFCLFNFFHYGMLQKNKDLKNHSVISKCLFEIPEQLVTLIPTKIEICLKARIT